MIRFGLKWNKRPSQIVIGIVLFGVALIVRRGLDGFLGDHVPFITFYPAVFIAAVLGGMWGGFLVTALSTAYVTWHLYTEPADAEGENWLLIQTLFFSIGILTSWGCELYRRTQKRMIADQEKVDLELRQALRKAEQAQRAVEIREAQYRQLFEGVLGSVILFDPVRNSSSDLADLLIRSANPSVLRHFEKHQLPFLGRPASEVFGRESVEPFLGRAQQVLQTGRGEQFETRLPYNQRDFSASMFRVGENRLGVMLIDVTETRRNEERLRNALSSTLDSVGEMIYTLDSEWRFTVVNRHTEGSFQRPRDQLIGRVFWDLYPGGKNSEKGRFFTRAMTERVPVHFETESRLHPGRWLDVRIYPAEEGGISVFAGDITERRRHREALLRSEQRWRGTFDASPVPIWEQDCSQVLGALKELRAQGEDDLRRYFSANPSEVTRLASLVRVTAVNRTCGQLFGLGDPENLHLPDFFNDASLRVFSDKLVALSEGATTFFAELPIRDARGQMWAVHMYVSVMPGHEDDLSRVLVSFVDVTALRRTQEALRLTEERFRLATEAMAGLVYEWDMERGTITRSKGITALLGYGLNETPSTTEWWHQQIHPDDLARTEERTRLAINRRESVLRNEYRIRHKQGHYIWVWDNARIVYDQEGKLIRWIGCTVSVDAHKRAEEELRHAHEQLARTNEELEIRVAERTALLRAALEELESFSYSLSHDMRAPLRAIQGFTRAVVDEIGPELSPEHQEYLGRVESSAERLQRLVLEVLSYSRVSRGDVEIQPVDVDALLRAIVRERSDLQPPHAEINILGTLLPMIGDRACMTQCLLNLLSNAVKYTRKDELARVQVWSESSGSNVRLIIEDNGIGIDKASVGRLFGLFQRANNSKGFEGTGLGLAIVKKAAERMNGNVGVQSQEGKGSRFWIELPGLDVVTKTATVNLQINLPPKPAPASDLPPRSKAPGLPEPADREPQQDTVT